MGLRPLVWGDWGFESRWGQRYLSLVCCRVEVSATGWPLVQMSPTECGVWECDREALIMRRSWPTRVCGAGGNEKEASSPHLVTAVSEVKLGSSCQELVFMWFQNSKLIKNLCLVFRVCAGMKQNSWLLYSNLLHLMSFRFKDYYELLWRSGSLLLRLLLLCLRKAALLQQGYLQS